MSWSQEYDKYLNHANWHAALSLFPEMEEEELRGWPRTSGRTAS